MICSTADIVNCCYFVLAYSEIKEREEGMGKQWPLNKHRKSMRKNTRKKEGRK
jgi:hypothetical protein